MKNTEYLIRALCLSDCILVICMLVDDKDIICSLLVFNFIFTELHIFVNYRKYIAQTTPARGERKIKVSWLVTRNMRGHGKGKEMLYLTTHSTYYLRLYGVGHMVKDHSDSERGNPLPPHRLLFSISSKGSFICIIPQTG